jgi:hypothetical protein
LTFHHVDPSKKRFNFAGAHSRSWESQVKEAQKCIVLCANCHREVHSGFRALPPELTDEVAAANELEYQVRLNIDVKGGRPRLPIECT